ncbi:MAG: MFS transporter [Alicyclobacillus sp.]|nr:MFS transporter [Alicyclobacillus sp.]
MESRSKARWIYIAPFLFLLWIVANMDKLGISIFVTDKTFLTDLGILNHPAAIGFTVTAFTLSYSVCTAIWGFIVDRIGPRKSGMLSVSLWGLCMLLGGLSTSYGWFLFARILLGLGEGAMWPMAEKFVTQWFHPKEYSRAQSACSIGAVVGPAIGAPVILSILAVSHWRIAFFTLAVISVVVMIPVLVWIVRDSPSQHWAANTAERQYVADGLKISQKIGSENKTSTMRDILRSYHYWIAVLAYFAQSAGYFGLGTWLPTYLKTARHFSAAVMGEWTSLAWLFGGILILLASNLADRTRRYTWIGTTAFVLTAIVMTVGVQTSQPMLAAAMMSIGMGINLINSNISPAVLLNVTGPEVLGRAAGIMTGASNIVAGLVPTIIGLLVQWSGGNYDAAIYFLICCVLIGAVAMLLLAPTEHRQRRAALQPAEQTYSVTPS